MPPPSATGRYQAAVLWEATGTDDYGRHTTAAPVEVRVRWDQRRAQVLDAAGNATALDATARVNRLVPVGSVLWLGTLENFLGVGSAGTDDELHRVVDYSDVKDVKGRWAERRLMLKRFRDKSPDRT